MAEFGESVSKRLMDIRQISAEKLVSTVPLSEAATPGKVLADQEKQRDALWQVAYGVTMDRMKRDLYFDLNVKQPGTVTHESLAAEGFVEKSAFWMPYLTPEQRRKFEADPVALTAREIAEGLTLDEKKKRRIERKGWMMNRERRIDWERGIDKWIWRRLNNRFFLESKGVVYADIDEELPKGFLETFDKEEEMYNFLLGVGWNQTLVDIFNSRSRLVDETREILSQRMFKRKDDGVIVREEGLPKDKGEVVHFDDLKNDEDKMNEIKHIFDWGDAEGAKKFGSTRELMRAVRIAQGAEKDDPDPKHQPKSLGLIHEKLLAKATTTKLDTFDGFDLIEPKKPETKKQLKERLREQLNNRAQVLFGDDFLNLTNEEQIMTAAGPGTILSLEEIMDFLSDHLVPHPYDEKKATLIRPESVDLEYVYWTKLKWVSMIGPWRLADRINKIIFSYSARDDQRALQRQQVESAGMSGFGKYTYFDWDYYEAFHGAGGEGGRKRLLEGTINKVEWPHGFWQEYQSSQQRAYDKYVAEANKVNNAFRMAGEEEKMKKIVDLDEFSYGMMGVGDYQHIAREWFLSGWRLVAEGVYLKLRGEAVEQAARRNVDAKQIDETLDGDVMGQKITHAGKEVLVKRYLEARRTVFLDVVELFRAWGDKTGHKGSRFKAALGDLFLDKFGLDFLLNDKIGLWILKPPLQIVNFAFFGGTALINLFSTRAVSLFSESIPWISKIVIGQGGILAALPSAILFALCAGGISLLKDKLYLRKEIGEAKWAETERKMNERFKALAENPQRTMIESGWDPNKASVDTHEPIKII